MALPVPMVLAEPQDVPQVPTQFRFDESRWQEAELKKQERSYEKNIVRVNG